ncbi:DUF4357 domain-containing protein [Yinghuangia sp. ASG 101]|uniref:DUF4357 domain-containing protein n=1 Tax=Yinghuangia sp. ASG 101 TaxID=2896848 RepID=UPI001E549F5A|nr:DUF4357 domain-containing protein [Yinghuangia sp. ASG 101]UGQ11286.1 DUF4357 domain-containing protein [Yinghuangia sp. ASG 101]
MSHCILVDDEVYTALTSRAAAQGISLQTLLWHMVWPADSLKPVKGRPGCLGEWIADGRLRPGQRIYLRGRAGIILADGNLWVPGLGRFGSLSAAADEILGYHCRGPAHWHTADGKPLMDL